MRVPQVSLEVLRRRSARCVRKRQQTGAKEACVRSAVNQTEAVGHSIAVVVEAERLIVELKKMCQCVTTECSFVGKATV
jgi:hypothetical protein